MQINTIFTKIEIATSSRIVNENKNFVEFLPRFQA